MVIIIINFIINFYQRFLSFDRGLLSVFAPGGSCRYEVSCSEYTKRAVRDYGVIRGISMGIKRIWSCR